MTMTSRERMMRTLEFDKPDRIPRQIWMLPVVWLDHERKDVEAFLGRWPVDITGAPLVNPNPSPVRLGDAYVVGRYRDEWGCEFENIKAGIHGQVKAPILADWSRLEDLRPPVESLDFDREVVNAFCRETDKFVMASACPRPFERMQFLRGSENLYMDLGEESPEVLSLLDIIHRFHLKEMEAWAQTDVDSLTFMDDWGSQQGLLISPAQWRRLFKPLYLDYVRIAHDSGKKIFMHSDGNIQSIYGDIVEIGVDAVNSQLFCMDIEEIGRRYAGKITFWGEIDRQHVLVRGDRQDARSAVKRVVDNLYRPEGGVIAQFSMEESVKLSQCDAVFEAWQELAQ